MAKKATLQEVGQMLEHVVKHMATKEDLNDLRNELGGEIKGVKVEMSGLRGQLNSVQNQVNSIEQQLREGRYERRIGDLEEKVFGSSR